MGRLLRVIHRPRLRRTSSVVGAAALLFVAACGREAEVPPNVVVILVDDMRWDDFGAGGHPFVQTPNIDRVAHEGHAS